jgi:hypothetical protein
MEQIASLELVKILEQVDAVISTPSTAILEAMLLGRPVAALDYHNVPRYLPTAWTISARDQIGAVVSELLAPAGAKMAFQRDCLADTLECEGTAAERIRELMSRMTEQGREARRTGATLKLPADLLGSGKTFHVFGRPPLAALYPEPTAFAESSVEALQVRLARAENERSRLEAENGELRKRVHLGSWLKAGVRQLTRTE